jgi:hypothetical protein
MNVASSPRNSNDIDIRYANATAKRLATVTSDYRPSLEAERCVFSIEIRVLGSRNKLIDQKILSIVSIYDISKTDSCFNVECLLPN